MYTFKSILKTRYNQSRLSRLTILGYSACSHAFRIISYGCHAISSRSYSDLILIIRGTPRELVCSISFELVHHTIIVYHTIIIIMPRSIRPFINLSGIRRTDHPSDQPESIGSTPNFFFTAAPSQKERKADQKTCSTYTKLTQVERFIHRLASTSLYLTSQGPMDIQEYLKHSSLSTSSPTSTYSSPERICSISRLQGTMAPLTIATGYGL